MVLKAKCDLNGGAAEPDGIWHCQCEADRQLAAALVVSLSRGQWRKLADRLGKPYPDALGDKYNIVYRVIGCKAGD